MEDLQTAILGFILKESCGDPYNDISPQVVSSRYNVDLEIVQSHLKYLTTQGIARQEINEFGLPKRILYDVRIGNNDPRSPKGSEFFHVDQKKLEELIKKVKTS